MPNPTPTSFDALFARAPLRRCRETRTRETTLRELERYVKTLDSDAMCALIASGESLKSRTVGAADRRTILRAKKQTRIEVDVDVVQPGQAQISFDHVREKLLELLRLFRTNPNTAVRRFFRYDRLRGITGSNGNSVILTDGHHKLSALIALRGLIRHRLCSTEPRLLGRAEKGIGELFGASKHREVVKIKVIARGVKYTPEKLWEALATGTPQFPRLFLMGRDGEVVTRPASLFAQLENNPYRSLASQVAAKVRGTRDKVELIGAKYPLWVKGMRASDFIEFHVAQTLEVELLRLGVVWKPGTRLSKKVLRSLRGALERSADAHGRLDMRLASIVVPKRWTRDEVAAQLRVGRKHGRLKLSA